MPATRNRSRTQLDRVLTLAKSQGAIRARDLESIGVPREIRSRLVEQGRLVRVARGLYRHPDAKVTAHHTLVEAAQRIPSAVVNLLSALAFHALSDEVPHALWLALPRNARTPKLAYPSLEITWSTPRLLEVGVEAHTIERVTVRVTGPARTVVDAFKYRRRVGAEVAVAALRDYLRIHRSGRDELWSIAGECRVQSVIRPYLEALS